MTRQLAEAREYEEENRVAAEEKPAFHFTPPVGWMNDPNGFSFYRGAYHLFYQYYPFEDKWGPMHWGHCTTKDFIRWDALPAALAPDSVTDRQGCFSGGAVTAPDGRHALLYTGCRWTCGKYRNEDIRQRQCIAFGDGMNYEKPALPGRGGNIVIDCEELPEAFSREDFRDPKIWKKGDIYYMVTASRAADGFGQILRFHSRDLLHWQYDGVLAHNDGAKYGIMWECPELAEIDGREVCFVSGQDMHAIGNEFQSGDHAFYFFRQKNGNLLQAIEPHNLDYGFDYYATQTLPAEDGRMIQLAWMQNWDTDFKPREQKWNGQVSLPRELSVRDGILYQAPVRELEKYRRELWHNKDGRVRGRWQDSRLSGRIMDLNLTLSGTSYREFVIHLAHDANFDFSIAYDRVKQTLTVDRTLTGSIRDIPTIRKMPVYAAGSHKSANSPLSLRILMDKCSAELFINDGAQTFSAVFYTPLSADEIILESDGETNVDIDAYKIVP